MLCINLFSYEIKEFFKLYSSQKQERKKAKNKDENDVKSEIEKLGISDNSEAIQLRQDKLNSYKAYNKEDLIDALILLGDGDRPIAKKRENVEENAVEKEDWRI